MAIVQSVENGTIVETDTTSSTSSSSGTDLGYDEFLKLLCAEMQYQDPLEPTSNTEYIAQLATFTQVETMLNMQGTIENNYANDLVGKYVIINTSSATDAGFVDYVEYSGGSTYIYVNGTRYSVDDIYEVADSEYIEAITLASAFESAVAQFPDADKLTLDYQEDFANLYTVYDGLTTYQKSYISDDTMTKFEELDGTMASLVFNCAVLALPSVDDLTLDDASAVETVREYYDSLTTYEKGYISDEYYDTLVELEDRLAELEAESSDEEVEEESDDTE